VGVVGCGYWGPKLARNLHELPETELAWVADFQPERLAHMRALHPAVRTTEEYADILAADVDALVIATPVSTHYALAIGSGQPPHSDARMGVKVVRVLDAAQRSLSNGGGRETTGL
jgi:hypothetical protein